MVQRLTFASCVSELFIARSSGTLLRLPLSKHVTEAPSSATVFASTAR